VAQLDADARGDLERAEIQLTPAEPATADPVSAAALQLRTGSQYVLVEHLAHPERFLDIRAQMGVSKKNGVAGSARHCAGW
jgi:hypothetical protein